MMSNRYDTSRVEGFAMRRSNQTWLTAVVGSAALAVLGVLMLCVAARIVALKRFSPAPVDLAMAKAGEKLFHHEWTAGDALSPDGDGLGPVFNAASCVACHNQAGPGGAGSREHNVITFRVERKGTKPRVGVLHAAAT